MGVLDTILKYKALEDAKEQQEVASIGNAVNSFIQGKALQQQDILKQLQVENIKSQIRQRDTGISQLISLGKVASLAKDTGDESLMLKVKQGVRELTGKGQDVKDFLHPSVAKFTPSVSVDEFTGSASLGGDLSQFLGQKNVFGEQTPLSKLAQKEAESSIATKKEAASQGAKAAELTGRDVLRASAAVDTTFDQALKFSQEQFNKFGLKPGQFLGIADKMVPSQWNKYKDAFTGAAREAASLVARQLIPGIRSANITEIFSKSVSHPGSTMEANAANNAASMGNAFSNALSQNIEVVDNNGRKVRIQDITIDPNTGKPLSKLSLEEKFKAINELKRQFANNLEQNYLKRVYKFNPELLLDETQQMIENSLTKDEIEELLSK